jgi:hypothetical protein
VLTLPVFDDVRFYSTDRASRRYVSGTSSTFDDEASAGDGDGQATRGKGLEDPAESVPVARPQDALLKEWDGQK